MVTPWLDDGDIRLYHGDALECLRDMPAESVQCIVTSPPYLGLRDYGHPEQIGLERTISEYVAALVGVFSEARRVLRNDGVLWLNIGDSYNAYNGGAGPGSKLSQTQTESRPRLSSGFGLQQKELKPKDLMLIPARLAIALQDDGWYVRSDVIWSKTNPMPESVTDRPTKAHEYVFLLSKSERYQYDADAIRTPHQPGGRKVTAHPGPGEFSHQARSNGDRWPGEGANARSVWTIATESTPFAHFATFPQALVERCIKAGSGEGDTVLDPFMGSGTTALVARRLGRSAVGIELNAEYLAIAATRLQQLSLLAAKS